MMSTFQDETTPRPLKVLPSYSEAQGPGSLSSLWRMSCKRGKAIERPEHINSLQLRLPLRYTLVRPHYLLLDDGSTLADGTFISRESTQMSTYDTPTQNLPIMTSNGNIFGTGRHGRECDSAWRGTNAGGLAEPLTLEKTDNLCACGVGELVDLPQIVVVGDQSSGKNSVLKDLIKKPLPRDGRLCTRFATQNIFHRAVQEQILVSFIPDRNASPERSNRVKAWRKLVPELGFEDSGISCNRLSPLARADIRLCIYRG